MICLTDGTLRAKLDGELRDPERLEADRHLEVCESCRGRLETLASERGKVAVALAGLSGEPNQSFTDPQVAFARFQAERERLAPKPARAWSGIFSRRWAPAWGAVAAAVVMAAFIEFAPARTWAQRVLAMLRVQKVAVLPVDISALPDRGADSQAGKMISQLISDNVVVTMSPGKPEPVASAGQASRLAGFAVRTLGDRTDAPHISVMGEQAFQMTINRDRVQAILDELGRDDLQLPESVNGAMVAVHIPKTVFVRYGESPFQARHPRGPGSADSAAPPAASPSNFVMLVQAPSPTVSVPPNLNVAQLAEIALEVTGMSPAEAQSFAQTVDWTSTLVIPVPRNATSSMKEEVDGVEGTLIVHPVEGRRPTPGYTLVWVKNGIIYALIGAGDGSNAVALADSLS